MIRKTFNEVVSKVPHLSAEGLLVANDPEFAHKRHDFVSSAVYLQQTNDALEFLKGLGKSSRFSQWQRVNCTPENILALVEWNAGRPVSPGAVIVAALSLGFTMGVQDGTKVYFNFLARQLETEMAQHRQLQQIRRVVGG